MKKSFFRVNERLFASKEVGGMGNVNFLRGKFVRGINILGRCLSYSSTRSYGCFLLSFGIMSLLLGLGEYYFYSQSQVASTSLLISLSIALVAIPLLVFDKPMCIAVQDFPVTDRMFFEFLSIKRMHRTGKNITIPPLIAMFIGFIPAIVGFFTSIELVVAVLALIICVAVALTSPEFPMIVTLLILPYVQMLPSPVLIICSLSALTFISYAMKVMVGKRVFNFDVYSMILLLISALALIGGLASDSGAAFKQSLVFVALLFAYFPTANIIVNRRLADCAINAMIVSSIPITVISIIEFIVELPASPYDAPAYSTPGISAFFSSTEALSLFILVSAILTLVLAIEKRKMRKKVFYFTVFLFEVAVLGFAIQPEVLLSGLIAVVAYPIIKSRKIPTDVLIVLILLPHLVLFLSSTVLDKLYDLIGLSISERIAGFSEAIGVFRDNLWLGTGRGVGAYIGASGGDSAGIFNTLIGLGCEFGIFVLALFGALVVIRLRHLSYFRPYLRNSAVCVTGEMTAVALTAMLSFGSLNYLFSDISVIYLFWSVLGISASALRSSKREYDELLGYYGDSRSSESSALDVGINN